MLNREGEVGSVRKRKYVPIFLLGLMLMTTPIQTRAMGLEDIIIESQEGTLKSADEQEINNDDYVEYIKDATNLGETSEMTREINSLTSKVASFIVQIVSYFITAFLAVRVILDLCYIAIPFSRAILSNGYQGNAQSSENMNNGMGGMGMQGGMPGGMGIPSMNMNGNQPNNMQGQGQVNNPMNKVQFISSEALNAVAAESVIGQNGKPNNAIKVYGRSAVKMLVITAILLTLAITGALTNLGFLIGELVSSSISNIGNML